MSKKIIFQKCNFNAIYFLCYAFTCIIKNLIKYYYHPLFWNEPKEYSLRAAYFLPYKILILYASNISDFIAVIPYFIRKKILKRNKDIEKSKNSNLNNESEEQNESSQLIYNDSEEIQSKKRNKLIIVYIIIISVLDFLAYFIYCLYNIIFNDMPCVTNDFNFFGPLNNIFQFVSSYLILKKHLCKLKYFSLFLNLALFIVIFIFDLINIIKLDEKERYAYLIYPLNYLFLDVEYSLVKKVILNGYASIYLLIVMRGFFKIILVIIFSSLMYVFNKENFFENIIFCLQNIKLLLFLSNIIIYFFDTIFLWILIDRFTPNYIPLAIIINGIIDFIISYVRFDIINVEINTFEWDFYVRIFLYIILTIGVLIYNEIIVINICGLASDTKYFLDLKLKNERLFSISDELEVLKKFETFDEFVTYIDEE